MYILFYLLAVCIIIFILVLLLPFILPAILFLVLLSMVFVWYTKRKIRKHMNTFERDQNSGDTSYTFDSHTTSSSNDDVIDVEFTEREDSDR